MLEMLMDPLGALVITFFAMSIVSIVAVALLYLSKNDKVKKGLLYFLSVWAVILSYCGVLSTPEYLMTEILISLAWGVMGIAGLLTQLISKNENKFQIARVLITIAIIAGMIDCFMI